MTESRRQRSAAAAPARRDSSGEGPPLVVLFDGGCALCSGFVRFLVARDRRLRLRFGVLGEDAARETCASAAPEPRAFPDSLVVCDGRRVLVGSDAVLAIARALPFPWRALAALRHVPRPMRDATYRFVARNRYRWFGRADACVALSPDRRLEAPRDAPALTPGAAEDAPPPSAG